MLTRFLTWIGLKRRPARPAARPTRPGSATAHLFEKRTESPNKHGTRQGEGGSDFNPYNTGKFDRSASWERISKTQR